MRGVEEGRGKRASAPAHPEEKDAVDWKGTRGLRRQRGCSQSSGILNRCSPTRGHMKRSSPIGAQAPPLAQTHKLAAAQPPQAEIVMWGNRPPAVMLGVKEGMAVAATAAVRVAEREAGSMAEAKEADWEGEVKAAVAAEGARAVARVKEMAVERAEEEMSKEERAAAETLASKVVGAREAAMAAEASVVAMAGVVAGVATAESWGVVAMEAERVGVVRVATAESWVVVAMEAEKVGVVRMVGRVGSLVAVAKGVEREEEDREGAKGVTGTAAAAMEEATAVVAMEEVTAVAEG